MPVFTKPATVGVQG